MASLIKTFELIGPNLHVAALCAHPYGQWTLECAHRRFAAMEELCRETEI